MRAYCTQPAKPMASTSTGMASASCRVAGSATRATPSMSSAIRIAGKESCTSATRMIDGVEPAAEVAGSSPSETPSTSDSSTEARPTPSEMRAPCMMVDRMSRPWLSVPSG